MVATRGDLRDLISELVCDLDRNMASNSAAVAKLTEVVISNREETIATGISLTAEEMARACSEGHVDDFKLLFFKEVEFEVVREEAADRTDLLT